jgi:hypothetical protein
MDVLGAIVTGVGVLASIVLGIVALVYSRNANRSADRTEALARERWFVDWGVEWNRDACLVVLHQIGGDTARGSRITVRGGGLVHEVAEPGDVQAGHDATVMLGTFGQLRDDYAAKHAGQSLNMRLFVRMEWRTGLGRPDFLERWADAQ